VLNSDCSGSAAAWVRKSAPERSKPWRDDSIASPAADGLPRASLVIVGHRGPPSRLPRAVSAQTRNFWRQAKHQGVVTMPKPRLFRAGVLGIDSV
jgi:hypothetical protein